MPLSQAQKQAMFILPRITAALSVLGSALILCSVLAKNFRRNNSNSRHRRNEPGASILAAMSMMDLMSSLMYVIGSVAFPESAGGKGNEATCNAQAFLVNLQVGAALYNGFLAWCYCLYICYEWREEKIRKVLEPFCHASVWVFVVLTGSYAIVLGLNKPHWIRCTNSTNMHMWAFFFGPIWASMWCGSLAMLLIYLKVRRTEKRSARHLFPSTRHSSMMMMTSSSNHNNNPTPFMMDSEVSGSMSSYRVTAAANPRRAFHKTRRVAYKSLGYTVAFICVYMFPTISRIIQSAGGTPPYAIRLLAVSLIGSQGFWNWLVYYVQPLIFKWWRSRSRSSATTSQQSKNSKWSDEHNCSAVGTWPENNTQEEETLQETSTAQQENSTEV